MTRLLLWNQPFPLIQISARVNKKLALQQVSDSKRICHTFVTGMLSLISSGLMWGLESFHIPVTSLSYLQAEP